MNLEQTWQSVLGQLQQEMPRASFETWVLDTEALSLEDDLLTISARNAYARDWLESRLANRIERFLADLLNQTISVRFAAADSTEQEPESDEEAPEAELAIEPVQWLDYDRIVQPHKQVVVKGYLRRLGMEVGPKAIWLYIGFHQAAWKAHAQGRQAALPSREVMRFSGLSEGAFWRLMKDPDTQSHLTGLVKRADPPQERRFRRGRDGRPHRAPIRYQVSMTPRLTRADAATLHVRLRAWLAQGASMTNALQDLLNMEPVQKLLEPVPEAPFLAQVDTVMDMARLETDEKFSGENFSPEIERLAQELHRRIVNCLGDIHLTHYFIEQVIPSYNLTPAQAWLVAVARDMAYINAHTGERRDVVTFKGGYREMAELNGSQRYKTVQGWLHPEWRLRRHGGDLTRFMQELDVADQGFADLRTDSMPRSFRVLLDEPLDANGRIRVDADGGNRLDAHGGDLNSFKHPRNTDKKNTSTTQHGKEQAAEAGVAPQFWELESLLQQNDVHPKVQRELLDAQASVHAFVSWVLYVASPQSGNLSDPLGYALSRLREHPLKEARGVFRQFADLPPAELLGLIDATPTGGYQLPPDFDHPLGPAWKKAMSASNRRLPCQSCALFCLAKERLSNMRLHFLIDSVQRALGAMLMRDLNEDVLAFIYPTSAVRTFHTFFCPPLRIVAFSSQGCILFDEVISKWRFVKLPACTYVIETGPKVDYRPFIPTILKAAPDLPQVGALDASLRMDSLLFALLAEAVADIRRIREIHPKGIRPEVQRQKFEAWERGQIVSSAGFLLDFSRAWNLPSGAVRLSHAVLEAEEPYLEELVAASVAGVPWRHTFPNACLRCGKPGSWRSILQPSPQAAVEQTWRYQRPENAVPLCHHCVETLELLRRADLQTDLAWGLWGPRFEALWQWHNAALEGRLPDWDSCAHPLWPAAFGGETWESGSGSLKYAEPRPPHGVQRSEQHLAALRRALFSRKFRGRQPGETHLQNLLDFHLEISEGEYL